MSYGARTAPEGNTGPQGQGLLCVAGVFDDEALLDDETLFDDEAIHDALEAASGNVAVEARTYKAATGRLLLREQTVRAILDLIPGLKDGAHRRLLVHSLLGQQVHSSIDENGHPRTRIKIPAPLLAFFQGMERKQKYGSYVARTFLKAHGEMMPEFKETGWQPGEYTRQIERSGVPANVLELIIADLSVPALEAGPLVDFGGDIFGVEGFHLMGASGARHDRLMTMANPGTGRAAMDARRDRDCRRADARKAAKRSPWEIHGRLLPLLNGAPGNVLTRTVRANAPAASAVALETEDLERRLRTLAALREIQLAPDIVYVPSCRMRTPRVFASAVSPAGLPRAVRKALFSGCLELDLTNAQLSIAARVWDVDVLIDHLQREGSVWPHLLAAVAGTHSLTYEEAKGALKAAVYGAVFGMSKRGLRRLLRATLSAGAAAVFLADPLVAAVLVARDRALDDIDADGGITDCFGHHRPLTAEPGSPRRKAECRSALAGGMQAYELKLLEPVVDEAIRVSSHRRPAFRIVCWLHDGFTISASAPGIEGRLVRLVAEQAERLGVPTSLEATRLGSERLTGGGATGRVRSRSARTGRANGPGAGHVVTPDHVRLAAIERGTRPGGPDGNCWMWTGAKNRDGYGYKRFGGPNKVAVHRMSWEAANGCRVPSGLVVRHTCHTPACVNPGHLVTGTQRENIADRDAAGRTARGEQNGRSSLTCDTVSEARRLAASGVPVRRIARRFGVNPSTARAAVRGKTWTHVA